MTTLNRLKQVMATGYRVSMNALPSGVGIVATILPRSFPGGPIPSEYRREFHWTEDLPNALERFAEEVFELEEPDWKKLGYPGDSDEALGDDL